MPAKRRILIADDHLEMARVLGDQLQDAGYAIELAGGGAEAIAALRERPADVIITDLRMDEVDGLDVLDASRQADPDVPVIIMTAFGAVETAVEAMKRGAYHYLVKPLRLEEALLFVERAVADRQLRLENRALRRVAVERSGLGAMVGRSRAMQALYELCERVAPSSAPVLVRGESGTGKELVARAIHFQGPRRDAPFVPVNCTAIPDHLLESELFGHAKGSFTGATAARRGLFVEADGGTLFLDEIGDMPLELQAKLLRVVEDGEVRAVGADAPRRVEVRLVTATHQNLEDKVKDGRFRADLFYRLNVVPIVIPPLRERTEDIPLLVEHFFQRARQRNPHSPVETISHELMQVLTRCPWPGNVRELENLIERLVVVSGTPTLDVAELETYAPSILPGSSPLADAQQRLVPLRQLEADYISYVIARCGGNKTRAAEILGIDVSTIHRRERAGGLS